MNVSININNNSNTCTVNLINFNINWHTEIRILNAFVENKNKDAYFFIYYPSKRLIYNFSLEIPTEIPSNNYYINISDFYSNNTGILFNIFIEPFTSENIDLIITLYIYSYNSSSRNFTFQYVNVTLILDYYSNIYYSILYNVNLTEYFEISINRAFISTNNLINKYNIFYPAKTLHYETIVTHTSSPIRPIYTPTNESTNNQNDGNDDNNAGNRGNDGNSNIDNEDNDAESTPSTVVTKKSSSKVSLGLIIGIVLGVLLFIGIIVGVVIFIRKRRKKIKNDKNKVVNGIPSNESEDKITTTSGNIDLTVPEKDMRKFRFETQSQFKIEFSIEGKKDLKDLRKLYFEKIKRNDLLNDQSIYFLQGGNLLRCDDSLVKDKFKNYKELYNIVVVDGEGKIFKLQNN